MTKHKFGGAWTTDKLERVRKYLCAYTTIFKGNPRARYFATSYVDAFAGTGHHVGRAEQFDSTQALDTIRDEDAEAYRKGSARIALEVEPPFDCYIFIESRTDRVEDLKRLATEFPQRAVSVEHGEANQFLQHWCGRTDWRKNRAVVFLDPYGMQVDWDTMVAIAETRAIDVWVLFPLGVAVNRLLTRAGPPPAEWAKAITRIFGTDEWQGAFYSTREEQTLFGPEAVQRREVDYDRIGQFFCNRLRKVFAGVADNPLPLLNSQGTPIYLLCFAAGNMKGAKPAIKIAQSILGH